MAEMSARTAATWKARAVVAGFIGTAVSGLALVGAYGLVLALAGIVPGTLGAWFAGLTENPAVQLVSNTAAVAGVMHLTIGILFGLVYAGYAEPHLSGPGWQRGMIFALAPWLLSLVVFFPLIGGGIFGFGLGAGPLPIVGNLLLHLLYGGVLGAVYARDTAEVAREDRASVMANTGADRGMMAGIALGAVLGAAFAVLIAALGDQGEALGLALLIGAVGGATAGAFVGSFAGLTQRTEIR